jgi:hypothetical protein
LVLPDFTYLRENADRIEGAVISQRPHARRRAHRLQITGTEQPAGPVCQPRRVSLAGRGAWPPGPGLPDRRRGTLESVRIRLRPRRIRAPGPQLPGRRSSGFSQGGTDCA